MDNQVKQAWEEAIKAWPVAKGTLAEVRKACNRPGCKRCGSGEKHPCWQFTCKVEGRSKAMHVPAEAVEEIRLALENGRRLERQMLETGLAILAAYRKPRQKRGV
ncbi:MAG: hypothetical protein RL095_4220 [Verrucomicrobiota bacterium]|jgi:hypothetical protein